MHVFLIIMTKNMQIISTKEELQAIVKACKAAKQTLGLVPTMGALHAGHASLVHHSFATMEQIIIVYEINLDTRGLNRCHLDQQRMIGLLDDEVHTRKTNHFVQLIAPLIDLAELGHKRTRLIAMGLKILR